jgi:hypothetical protein
MSATSRKRSMRRFAQGRGNFQRHRRRADAARRSDRLRGATPGRDPPPEIAFADAAAVMSPMALSFWQECRRVRNDKLKRELGVTLLYPTYREGLRALNANSVP